MKKTENESKSLTSVGINWYPGHMAKTKRLIKEKIDLIDIVVEIIDARMPYSSKIKDLDEIVGNKKRILILSKKDLCDLNETKKWITHYESLGYEVLCMDVEREFSKKLFLDKVKVAMKDVNEKRSAKGLQTRRARLLVVGIPNVGKSTFINRLVGRKVATVGNKPGVTKSLDWIRLSNEVELLDTPGVLWPKFEEKTVAFNLASLTAIKEEVLPIYDVVVYILRTLEKYYPQILEERYHIQEVDEDILPTLDEIGKKRGCLMRGGLVDYDKVYTIVLNDIKNGIIKGITFDRYGE